MSILLFILGIVLFVGLVIVHEFGHYIAARRNGIVVKEFGLGFPPRAKIITKKKGTIYSLNWIPFGGFVSLKGEHDADTSKNSFGAASLWVKVKVMVTGVVMNLLIAFVLLTILALIGMPQLLDHQFTVPSDTKVVKQEVLIGDVEPNSPASQIGVQPQDQLISVQRLGSAPVIISSQSDLQNFTKQNAGQSVEVTFKHGQQEQTKTATLRTTKEVEDSQKASQPKGYLGVDTPSDAYTLKRSTYTAPVVALGLMGQFTAVTFQGLGSLIGNLFQGHVAQATSAVAGPVGVVYILKDGTFLGIQFILLIVAVISLTLAIFNILPIPALDGGRLFLILAHRLFKRKLTPEREDLINGIAFLVLLVLILLITFVDLRRNQVLQHFMHLVGHVKDVVKP